MDAIENLVSEHRTIVRVLDALVAFVEDVGRRGATEKEELGRFVTFVREYADALHHGKEEDVLFAALVAHGFPRQGGPVAVMLHEHDQGRALVRVLADHAGADGAWTGEDRQSIADHARAFAELLRAHIHKEDAILYPMAEQRLPPDALAQVDARCAELDVEQAAAAERLAALADALVRAHGPAADPTDDPLPTPHRFGCCA